MSRDFPGHAPERRQTTTPFPVPTFQIPLALLIPPPPQRNSLTKAVVRRPVILPAVPI
jgi:hypothetical protein